jgi:hypothetical protein
MQGASLSTYFLTFFISIPAQKIKKRTEQFTLSSVRGSAHVEIEVRFFSSQFYITQSIHPWVEIFNR